MRNPTIDYTTLAGFSEGVTVNKTYENKKIVKTSIKPGDTEVYNLSYENLKRS